MSLHCYDRKCGKTKKVAEYMILHSVYLIKPELHEKVSAKLKKQRNELELTNHKCAKSFQRTKKIAEYISLSCAAQQICHDQNHRMESGKVCRIDPFPHGSPHHLRPDKMIFQPLAKIKEYNNLSQINDNSNLLVNCRDNNSLTCQGRHLT